MFLDYRILQTWCLCKLQVLELPREAAVWFWELTASSFSFRFVFLIFGRHVLGDNGCHSYVVLLVFFHVQFRGVAVQSSAYNWNHVAAHHRFWVEIGLVEFYFSYFLYLVINPTSFCKLFNVKLLWVV